MASAKKTVKTKIGNLRFHKAVKRNAQGSFFLGYAYFELCVEGILGGSDLRIGMPDVQIRLTRNGEPRIEFPSDLKQVGEEKKWIARYFAANAATREILTGLLFNEQVVLNAVTEADALGDA